MATAVYIWLHKREVSVIHPIHTAVSGRARFKVEGLYRSEALRRHLEARLAAIDGIHAASASALTGNVLVHFDPARRTADIMALLERVVAEHGGRSANGASGCPSSAPTPPGGQVDRSRPQTAAAPLSRHVLRRLVAGAEEQGDAPWHHSEPPTSASLWGIPAPMWPVRSPT
jgi:Heavy metal associated domain 2